MNALLISWSIMNYVNVITSQSYFHILLIIEYKNNVTQAFLVRWKNHKPRSVCDASPWNQACLVNRLFEIEASKHFLAHKVKCLWYERSSTFVQQCQRNLPLIYYYASSEETCVLIFNPAIMGIKAWDHAFLNKITCVCSAF